MTRNEINEWIFERTQIQGHLCDGIKENVDGEVVNIGWRDKNTGDEVFYDINW